MKKKVDVIIFDLDGTLLDSQDDIIDSVNLMLKKLGLKERPAAQIRKFIGYGANFLVKGSLGSENEKLFDQALEAYTGLYRGNMFKKTKLYDGVIEVLEHFKDKKLAIISNKRAKFAEEQMAHYGILKYFYEVIGGDREECLKPSACPINELVAKHGLAKDRIIIVGDMEVDIQAGKNAGNITCAVTYGIGDKEAALKENPDFVIDDIRGLKEIIE